MFAGRAKTCGVVLAGGRSSRMGRDKAQLPLPGGGCFLEQALELMRGLPLAQLVVSGARPGGIADPLPGLGPVGGLYGVACAVEADGLLAIPVDMPLLRADLLARLLENGERSLRACHFTGHHFPLWLPLSPAVKDFLVRAVHGGGETSIGALLRCAEAQRLPVPESGRCFDNINTPAQYAREFTDPHI